MQFILRYIKNWFKDRAYARKMLALQRAEEAERLERQAQLEAQRREYEAFLASLPEFDDLAPVGEVVEIQPYADYAPKITITLDNKASYKLLEPNIAFLQNTLLVIRADDMPSLYWVPQSGMAYGTANLFSAKELIFEIPSVGTFKYKGKVFSKPHAIGLNVQRLTT